MRERAWFERKIRELGELLRRLPTHRGGQVIEALERDEDPAPRHGTGRFVDESEGESDTRAGAQDS